MRHLNDSSLFHTTPFVAGKWISAGEHGTRPLLNPATGEHLANVPQLGVAEARAAIEAAHEALAEWRARPAKERSIILRRWFELIIANADDLAALIVLEEGKPF